MAFINLDRIALRIGNDLFANLSSTVQQRIIYSVDAVEQALAGPPWGFDFSNATKTEYLPSAPRVHVDRSIELGDFDRQANGTIVTAIYGQSSTTLQLTRVPVLLAGLTVYEDFDGYSGQSPSAFPSGTLLTQGVDYFLDCQDAGVSNTGILHRIGTAWPSEPRSVKVTYKGGPEAARLAKLGPQFTNVFEECVAACALHNYAFWESQRLAIEDGTPGQNKSSESIGKYSVSYQSPAIASGDGMSSGGFGGTPTILPEDFLGGLAPYVNLGALITR